MFSFSLNISKYIVIMLLYCCWNLDDTLSGEFALIVLFSQSPT